MLLPPQAYESLALTFNTVWFPLTVKYHWLPAELLLNVTLLVVACPFQLMLVAVNVVPVAKRSLTSAIMTVLVVQVVVAVKSILGSLCASEPESFVTVNMLKAEEPVNVPDMVWREEPSKVTVPVLELNVPLLLQSPPTAIP